MLKDVLILLTLGVVFAGATFAAPEPNHAWLPLGGSGFTDWHGLSDISGGAATLTLPEAAVFRYPQGPKGWYIIGFRDENDGTRDWSGYGGVQMDVKASAGRAWRLQATLRTPTSTPRQTYLLQTRASVGIPASAGWQQVTIPWTDFDYDKSQGAFLKFIQELHLSGQFADGKPGTVQIKNVRLTRAPNIALEAPVRGQATAADGMVHYAVTVTNCTDGPQDVALAFDLQGWEAMPASVKPDRLHLASGASAACVVSVHVPADVPPGGHETQTLLALDKNGKPARLEFITACDVNRPSIQLTAQDWDAVRQKVKDYAWAKAQQDAYVKDADAWTVPAPVLL